MSPSFAEPLQQVDRTYVLWRGRKLSYFAGCDYLRLSSHPAILKEIRSALVKFGLNVSASRKTTGNHRLYDELEKATCDFFHASAALLTSSGYLTNIVAAQGLHGKITHAFLDERAHGSLRDAAIFLRCPVTEFSHRNPVDLKNRLGSKVSRRGIAVLTDGMFAHDGSIAPLREYRNVIGPDALLWVDDAHAAGILGTNGRGSMELAGLSRRNLLQTITFSKAFGSYGGAILSGKKLRAAMLENSCAVGGNTPIPLPLASAALRALQLCQRTPVFRARLWINIRQFWKSLGQSPPPQLAPIISIPVPNPASARHRLLAANIHPPFIQYPGGPAGGYFRIALSSEHTREQITRLAEVLASCLKQTRRVPKTVER